MRFLMKSTAQKSVGIPHRHKPAVRNDKEKILRDSVSPWCERLLRLAYRFQPLSNLIERLLNAIQLGLSGICELFNAFGCAL